MASRATSARQAIAAASLTVLAAVALRGYLPGAPTARREPAADHPLSTVFVTALLILALAVVVVAVVTGARHRTTGPAGTADRPAWLRADLARPSWRTLVIASLAVAVALGAALALSALGGRGAPDAAAPMPAEATPNPTAARPDGQPPGRPDVPHDNVIGYLAVAAGGFVVVLVVGSVVARRRQTPVVAVVPDDAESSPRPRREAETLARATEVGLATVEDHRRDPRAAIIACYLAMERELARVPDVAPRDWDTAAEVLARAVDHRVLRPDHATQLVDLFDEARFSPHVMSEAHRELAHEVLQRVLDELRVPR